MLAPVALYPDAVLAQVLSASTNAQEVLDAGNWLLDNQSLQGDALTKAAADADFSPNVQALVHFPTVVDMMCRELDWTKQVGAAFTADQGAVLASVQRLRAQATAAGNLKSSPELTVEQTKQNDKDVIIINNPDPQVVYVPQYNPTTVYTAPPATTTTTTDSGISTSDAVVGGLLAFGAGIAVASLFDNDNHNDNYCYPNWGHGGVYYGGRPYYPHNTFVYAPRGAGYRPTPYYRPPANYQNRYNNNYNRNNNVNRNTNINVNNNNNYMNRFDKNQNRLPSYNARSPVAASNARNDYRGQSTYNGADRPPCEHHELATSRQCATTRCRAHRTERDDRHLSGRANRAGGCHSAAEHAAAEHPAPDGEHRPTTRRRGGQRLSEDDRQPAGCVRRDAEPRWIDQRRGTQRRRRRPGRQRARSQQHEIRAEAVEQRAGRRTQRRRPRGGWRRSCGRWRRWRPAIITKEARR